jgi:hypothetical protein
MHYVAGIGDFLYIYHFVMRSFRLVLTLGLVLLGTLVTFSAPGPPSSTSTGGAPGCWPPPCIPIDGGITILIAAGAAYGAKKIFDSRKNNQHLS